MGDPTASLGRIAGKDDTGSTTSGPCGDGLACRKERSSQADRRYLAQRHKRRAGEARGSLSGFTVPFESRRTEPWEPGNREGNRLVVAAPGKQGQDSEPVAFVYGTDAGGDGRLPTIGRTVCGKSARTGLWGSRWATTGSTRKAVNAYSFEYFPLRRDSHLPSSGSSASLTQY
jgi:hypothetical protein